MNPAPVRPRIAILSCYFGSSLELAPITRPNKEAYASRHGYHFEDAMTSSEFVKARFANMTTERDHKLENHEPSGAGTDQSDGCEDPRTGVLLVSRNGRHTNHACICCICICCLGGPSGLIGPWPLLSSMAVPPFPDLFPPALGTGADIVMLFMKLEIMSHYLSLWRHRFDWIFWADADALFLNFSESLEQHVEGLNPVINLVIPGGPVTSPKW